MHAPVEKIWKAITDREEMQQWYFDIAAFKPEVGFEFTFTGENKGAAFVHLCQITEIVKSWLIPGGTKDMKAALLVTWKIFAEGDKTTTVRLTHEGLESFPADDPSFKKENFIGGWTYIIDESLTK